MLWHELVKRPGVVSDGGVILLSAVLVFGFRVIVIPGLHISERGVWETVPTYGSKTCLFTCVVVWSDDVIASDSTGLGSKGGRLRLWIALSSRKADMAELRIISFPSATGSYSTERELFASEPQRKVYRGSPTASTAGLVEYDRKVAFSRALRHREVCNNRTT